MRMILRWTKRPLKGNCLVISHLYMLAVLKLMPAEGKDLDYTEWTGHSIFTENKISSSKKKNKKQNQKNQGLQCALMFCLYPFSQVWNWAITVFSTSSSCGWSYSLLEEWWNLYIPAASKWHHNTTRAGYAVLESLTWAIASNRICCTWKW